MMFAPFATASPHIKSGKLRALGVASLKRSPQQPAVTVRTETLRWAGVIRQQNLKPV